MSVPVFVVFWSWQSDSDSRANRNFIADCLSRAVKELAKGGTVLTVDRDTAGIGGTPDISETIFRKIRECDCQRAGYLILLGAAKVIPHSTPPRPC